MQNATSVPNEVSLHRGEPINPTTRNQTPPHAFPAQVQIQKSSRVRHPLTAPGRGSFPSRCLTPFDWNAPAMVYRQWYKWARPRGRRSWRLDSTRRSKEPWRRSWSGLPRPGGQKAPGQGEARGGDRRGPGGHQGQRLSVPVRDRRQRVLTPAWPRHTPAFPAAARAGG